MPTIRFATPNDAAAWLKLRQTLWPESSEAEHRDEIAQFFLGNEPRSDPQAVLFAADADGHLLGFAELSLRPCAEGCVSSPVAYLEGWFVLPEARQQGVGRALVKAAENWGRSRGCREFASDTEPENDVSAAAHLALGFADAGLVRCFRKDL